MALEIRVLVVEDDPETRMLTEALLSGRKGVCLCALAKDGLEGLELVEQTEQLANTAFVDAEAAERAQEQQISNNQLKYTIIIISSLPMLIAYPFFQKYFVQGVMLGSLKE